VAGPGTATRGLGTGFLALALLLAAAMFFVPWGVEGEIDNPEEELSVWTIKTTIATTAAGKPVAFNWFDDDLDDRVEGLGLFRAAAPSLSLGAFLVLPALIISAVSHRQRRRFMQYGSIFALGAALVLLVGLVFFLMAAGQHVVDKPTPRVSADADDWVWMPGFFIGWAAFLCAALGSLFAFFGARKAPGGSATEPSTS
jgi:hypothetical protein